MPEHIHFVIFVEESGRCNLSEIISRFKVSVGQRWAEINGKHIPVFEDGYHDRILLKKGQLKKMLRYVSDNPRRRLERIQMRGFHSRHRLADIEGNIYEAYGNIHLLEDSDIEAVKISRSYPNDLLRKKKLTWKRNVENCGVLASPFISAAEKKVRDWCIDNGGRMILIEENGFGERYSPKGKLHDLCSQGRLLIVAPAHHSTQKVTLSKDFCESLNELASDIAKGKIRRI